MATATQVCSLENYLVLPDHTLDERIGAAKRELGRELVILGHHYQRDEVIRFADFRGDSYRLSQEAASAGGKYIVFCGERGGVVCTSSNAAGAFQWGFEKTPKLLFLPDQHLGRNTGYRLGIPLSEMAVWDPYMLDGGLDRERLQRARVILWKGHCSVHQRFLPEHVDNVRAKYPGIRVIVHPECRWEVCQKADGIGSTEGLLKMIRQAPAGTM